VPQQTIEPVDRLGVRFVEMPAKTRLSNDRLPFRTLSEDVADHRRTLRFAENDDFFGIPPAIGVSSFGHAATGGIPGALQEVDEREITEAVMRPSCGSMAVRKTNMDPSARSSAIASGPGLPVSSTFARTHRYHSDAGRKSGSNSEQNFEDTHMNEPARRDLLVAAGEQEDIRPLFA
jgi:hypothetical protein